MNCLTWRISVFWICNIQAFREHCRIWLGVWVNLKSKSLLASKEMCWSWLISHNTVGYRLNLYGNFLTGTIPAAVGRLTSLQILELSENSFHGHLPAEIMLLSDLMTLSLKQTNGNLDGNLPSFSMYTQLRELNLASNRFQGSIPEKFLQGIENKSSTILVNLGFNQLTGVIPESLASFERLELGLEGNQISG